MNGRIPITEIWVYLSGSPLFALILTLVTYQFGYILYVKANRNPLVNPVAVLLLLATLCIYVIDMPYKKYFEGVQFVHFLLGTATIALAVLIYRGAKNLKDKFILMILALVTGSAVQLTLRVQ